MDANDEQTDHEQTDDEQTDDEQRDHQQSDRELRRILAALRGDTAYLFTFVDRCGATVASMLTRAGAPQGEVEGLVHEVAFAVLELVATWDPRAPADDLLAASVGTVWPRPDPGPGRGPRRPPRPDLVLVEGCGRDTGAGARSPRTLHLAVAATHGRFVPDHRASLAPRPAAA